MTNRYLDLITNEHREKPKYRAIVDSVSQALLDAFDATRLIPSEFDLDTAVGAQLDVIGEWVGQSRYIPGVFTVLFFGFLDNPVALPFGEEGDPSIGGRFFNEGESYTETSKLADPEYRLLIKARIIRNTSKGTTADVVRGAEFLFQAPVYLHDIGDMSFNIAIARPLTIIEKVIVQNLDIIPRPAGVRIAQKSYFSPSSFFGFNDTEGAKTFGEEGITTTYSGSFSEAF